MYAVLLLALKVFKKLLIFMLNYIIVFNCTKTKAMYFPSKFLKLSNFPTITMKGVDIEFLSKVKYLGITICDNLSDDSGIKARVRSISDLLLLQNGARLTPGHTYKRRETAKI